MPPRSAGVVLGAALPVLGLAVIAAFNAFYWLPIRGESPRLQREETSRPPYEKLPVRSRPQGGTAVSELRRLVETHYENQTTGHPERDAEVFTPDVVSIMPGGPPMHGIDAFNQHAGAFASAFPDARFEIRNTIESDGAIVVEGAYTGTHTGPLAGPQGEIPPTGRSVSVDYADVFVLDGDRFGEHRVYFDSLALMAQLGLMPG